jgi:Xaa-Pro aminopeptidase
MFEPHFQTFTDTSDKAATPARLTALRAELARLGLNGFVIPHSDRHQNEYLPPSEERLAWLTAFTGSAGRAIVLAERAALFVDGRYTLQAREQVDLSLFELVLISDTTPEAWMEASLAKEAKLGFDPWLHTHADVERLMAACATAGAALTAIESNPIDAVWTDRPAEPLSPISIHDLQYSGEAAAEKLARIRAEIAKARANALVVTSTPAIAWAFNIRAGDVAHTPVTMAYAIVPAEGRPSLYVDSRKLSNAVRDELEQLATIAEPASFECDLLSLGTSRQTVRVDPASTAEAISKCIEHAGGKVLRGSDPIAPMKAVKNATEIDGARRAHRRDGIAVTRFLAWFDGEAARGQLTEIDCVAALETFRRETGALQDVSFPTIAGSGPNGAIVHYRVTEATNRRIGAGELFLVDSGAQYLDGTTDITRTISVGAPSGEMRDRFTRVLKGHIAIARAIFPEGAGGAQIDTYARQHLWNAGLDYDHGTGHGVGSYLSVHEGPVSIHKTNLSPLKRGMILSNEPGYYKTGAYGIRIENLVLVVSGPEPAGAEKSLNAFETLTLAPIDVRLVEPSLMSADELAWLNAYHARVWRELSPDLASDTRAWLEAATQPIAH